MRKYFLLLILLCPLLFAGSVQHQQMAVLSQYNAVSGYSCTGSLDWDGTPDPEEFSYGADDFCCGDIEISDTDGRIDTQDTTYTAAPWCESSEMSIVIDSDDGENYVGHDGGGSPDIDIGYFSFIVKIPDIAAGDYWYVVSVQAGNFASTPNTSGNMAIIIDENEKVWVSSASTAPLDAEDDGFDFAPGDVAWIAGYFSNNQGNNCSDAVDECHMMKAWLWDAGSWSQRTDDQADPGTASDGVAETNEDGSGWQTIFLTNLYTDAAALTGYVDNWKFSTVGWLDAPGSGTGCP